MPWSALPPHINEPHEWTGKDDDQHWYTSWRKSVKGWFAFGPRATEWWARWRELPITLLAFFGEGDNRWESSGAEFAVRAAAKPIFFFKPNLVYLSRIQYWCRWSIQLQWPLFFAAHIYTNRVKRKVLYVYVGAKRDGDKVYWFPAIFIGRTFK